LPLHQQHQHRCRRRRHHKSPPPRLQQRQQWANAPLVAEMRTAC
jgi:hypothetical protein